MVVQNNQLKTIIDKVPNVTFDMTDIDNHENEYTYDIEEQHIYGSSRLGVQKPAMQLSNIAGRMAAQKTTINKVGDKRYELSNHLGNVLEVITDKKIRDKEKITTFIADVVAYNDYYPFGMLVPNRNFSSPEYRYGFHGQEKDDEVMGEGNWQEYGMRMYNPRIVRFPSVDPITSKYPMLTPYQFASNSPIANIDQDGLEAENAHAYYKAARYGIDALKIKRVDDGFGKVQSQLYTLKASGNLTEFTKLRETMLNSPQTITNNFYATYAPVQKANTDILTPGDEIGISIVGVLYDVNVRVMDVQQTNTSFKMTFATLEGHTDAGYITFSGSLNEETGEINFSIFNETRQNYGAGVLGGRAAQQDQWEDVIGNARRFLGKEKKDVIMTENIKTYKYDESQPMGKGKLTGNKTEKIDE